MSDVLCLPYPERSIAPDEPGLIAGYSFSDGELAQFGRYLNRATAGGAAYDLTTRQTTPGIGIRGGLLGNRALPFGSWWRGVVVPVGNVNFSYTMEHEQTVVCTGFVAVMVNGLIHSFWTTNTGHVGCSFQGGVTSETPWSVVGRGVARYDALYDGTDQILLANGRVADQDAVAPAVLGANLDIGQHGETSLVKVYNIRRTVAQARESYVREFASRLVYAWRPVRIGEGPAAGIPTGAVGEGDWFCPSGGATLQFVWITDLSLPNGGYLALTDSGALSMRRLDFTLPKSPMFGSWLVRYRTRNPIVGGDNPYVGLIRCRGDDMTAAGSQSIWVQGRNTGGGWWRCEASRENAGLIGVDVDHAVTAAGDDGAFLLTHHVDGNWRIYSFSRLLNGWFWRAAAVVNNVTFLSYNYISIAPRLSYIKSVEQFQGEMDPHELARNVLR